MQSRQNLVARLLAAALVSGAAMSASAAQPGDATLVAQAQPATTSAADGDTLIVSKVQAALKEAPSLSALQVEVSSKDGIVVLKGSAPAADAAQQAVKLAAAVPGVKGVRSELKLPS